MHILLRKLHKQQNINTQNIYFSKKYLTTRTPKLRLATAIPAAYTVNSFHNPFPGKQGEKIGKRVDAKMEKTESIKRKE